MTEAAEREFKKIDEDVTELLESMSLVQCSSEDYLQALKDQKQSVEDYLDTCIDAAQQDIKRKRGA